MMTITVEFLGMSWDFVGSAIFRRYFVPTDATQCIPNTAHARMTPHIALFHHESVQAARRAKNTDSAVILAKTAITAEPTTYPTL